MAKANPGETWGYRVGRKLGIPLSPVEVLGIPGKRRVVIRHLEGAQAGEQEEVPLQRLVVPWDEAADVMEDERRLKTVYDTPWGDYGMVELDAVRTVATGAFDFPLYIITPGYGEEPPGVLYSAFFPTLADAVGMSEEELLSLPNAFVSRSGTYWAPFVAAVEITKRYCQHDPANVLEGTQMLEEQLETLASTAHFPFGMPVDHAYAADNLRRVRPSLDLLRSWCGGEALEEWSEIETLRAEIDRLQELIENIAAQIREAGNPELATRLRQVMLNTDQEPTLDLFPGKRDSTRRRSR